MTDMKKVNAHLVKPAKIQLKMELEVPGNADLSNIDLADVCQTIVETLMDNLITPTLVIRNIKINSARYLHKDNKRQWRKIYLDSCQ